MNKKILIFLLFICVCSLLFPATVVIASGTEVVLSNGGTMDIPDNLLIEGTLSGATNSNVILGGNWTNNGSFIANGVDVQFDDSGHSYLWGSSPSDFYDLTINKTENSVGLDVAISVSNELSLLSGNFIEAEYDSEIPEKKSRVNEKRLDPTDTADLTMGNDSEIIVANGELQMVPNFTGVVDITYNGTSAFTPGDEFPTAQSVLDDLTINTTGGVTLNADATVNGSVSCMGSKLITSEYILYIASGATTSEDQGAYIEGEVIAEAVTVGTGTYNKLKFSVAAGTDDIGDLTLTRYTGSSYAQTLLGTEGIDCYWDVNVTSDPANGRNLTLSWFPGWANGINSSIARMWNKEDGGSWLPTGYAHEASDFRTVTENIDSFSNWTVGGHVMNDPVVMQPLGSLTMQEDGTDNSIDLGDMFWEPNNQLMEFTYSGDSNITVTINADNTVTLEPDENWSGSEEISFHADQMDQDFGIKNGLNGDDFRGMTTDILTVTVEPLNDPPVVANAIPDFSINANEENSNINLNAVFTDPDLLFGDNLTYSSSYNPDVDNIEVSINQETGVVTLDPAIDWVGVEDITFTATDDSAAFVSDAVTITVAQIEITSPNIMDIWVSEWTYTIAWESDNVEFVDIFLIPLGEDKGFENFTLSDKTTESTLNFNSPSDDPIIIAENINASSGEYEITIFSMEPGSQGECAVVIVDSDFFDVTDAAYPILLTHPGYPEIVTYPTSLYSTLAVGEVENQTITISNREGESILAFEILEEIPIEYQPPTDPLAWSTLEYLPCTFTPGQSYNLTLTLNNLSFYENPIVGLVIDIPTGLTLNYDATNFLNEEQEALLIFDPESLQDNQMVWLSPELEFIVPGETAQAVINITVDSGYMGDMELDYFMLDIFGEEQPYYYGTMLLQQDWLGINPNSGWIGMFFDEKEVNVTFDATALDPGTYTKELYLINNSNPAYDNEIQTLTFILNVGDSPELVIDIPSIEKTLDTGATTSETLQISNDGDMSLTVELDLEIPMPRDESTDDLAVFFDNMENGINGWYSYPINPDVQDLWHQTTANYNSSNTSWWCGVDNLGNYNSGSTVNAALRSPVIDLAGLDNTAYLSFHESYNTNDNCTVQIALAEMDTWETLQQVSGNSDGWQYREFDISDYIGNYVFIRFIFDSGGSSNNEYPGWFIDDVAVADTQNYNDHSVSWLSLSDNFLIIAPGASVDLEVYFDAAELPRNEYNANIVLDTNDPENLEVVVPVTLNVNNNSPTISLPEEGFTFAEEGTLIEDFTEYVEDFDEDELTLSVSGDDDINVSINGLQVTFTAEVDWFGSETLTFTVSDNIADATANDDVLVTVTNVNDPPVITEYSPNTPFDMDEGDSQDFWISVTDADGDDLTYQWYYDTGDIIGATESTYTYNPDYTSAGLHYLDCWVSDEEARDSVSKSKVKKNNPTDDQTHHEWTVNVFNVDQNIVVESLTPAEVLSVIKL